MSKKRHKKPPVSNNQTMITITARSLEKANQEARDHIRWVAEMALQEEFDFGPKRIERFRQKMDEIAKKKTFEAYVDYKFKQEHAQDVWSIPAIVRM